MANQLSVFTYTPSEVKLIVGGYVVTGWEAISIRRNKRIFNPVEGIRGKNTRVKNLDTSATIAVPLIQTSQSNDVFSEILRLDSINGTGRISLTLKDRSGNSIFSSTEAYITDYPEASYTDDIETRNWTIYCQSTSDYAVNGNASTSDLASIFSSAYQTLNNIF